MAVSGLSRACALTLALGCASGRADPLPGVASVVAAATARDASGQPYRDFILRNTFTIDPQAEASLTDLRVRLHAADAGTTLAVIDGAVVTPVAVGDTLGPVVANGGALVLRLTLNRATAPRCPPEVAATWCGAVGLVTDERRAGAVTTLESGVARVFEPALVASAIPPGPPVPIVAIPRDGAVEVHFDAPADPGDCAALTYHLAAPSGGATEGAASPLTLGGLANGSPVTLTLWAACDLAESTPVSVTATPAVPATPSGARLGVPRRAFERALIWSPQFAAPRAPCVAGQRAWDGANLMVCVPGGRWAVAPVEGP